MLQTNRLLTTITLFFALTLLLLTAATPTYASWHDNACVIPASGPWPACATGGDAPPANLPNSCVIPPSGPWPACATGGGTTPMQPTQPTGDCIIPPSGPWPACATGGGGTTPTIPMPTPEPNACVIPPSGPWPRCATNPTNPTQPAPTAAIYQDASRPIDVRVADLLGRMTLDEKVGQMTLVQQARLENNSVITDFAIGGSLTPDPQHTDNSAWGWYAAIFDLQEQATSTRLGVPIFYGVDAVHGQARAWGTTIFPHNIGLGATNDVDLVERVGKITAQETAAMGVNWAFDPVLAVPQDIRWGRTFEAFAENTAHVSRLGAAKLRGLQQGELGWDRVLGTPKHFAADGGTTWGSSDWAGGGVQAQIDRGNAIMDEATLREVHIAPYQEAIRNGARSIMVSYSSWNGTKLHADRYLLTDVLKDEMGFSGFLVSDWGAIDHIAPTKYEQTVVAINAGIDMVMLPDDYAGLTANLKQAVANGDIAQSRIDDAVRRILRVKFEMGLFERPMIERSFLSQVGREQNRAVAREAVQKSLVLLKNDGNALPISKGETVFVAGEKAHDIGKQSGGWTIEWAGVSGNWLKGTSILDGIRQVSNGSVNYDANGNWSGNGTAAICIVAVGEDPYVEWRGDDGDLTLSAAELALLQRIRPRCQTVVGVIVSGRPLIITEQLPLMDAVVAAWLPGSEGIGVADVLFGDQPFRGTLPFSWPRSVSQLPFDFAGMAAKGCSDALFPYGYGLNVNDRGALPVCRP